MGTSETGRRQCGKQRKFENTAQASSMARDRIQFLRKLVNFLSQIFNKKQKSSEQQLPKRQKLRKS